MAQSMHELFGHIAVLEQGDPALVLEPMHAVISHTLPVLDDNQSINGIMPLWAPSIT